jgi:hypothetical protein
VKTIYEKRHTFVLKMEKGMVTSYAGMKEHKGSLWVHHFLICQAFISEAECTIQHNLKDWTLLDSDEWAPFINNPGQEFYGTCLCWNGGQIFGR